MILFLTSRKDDKNIDVLKFLEQLGVWRVVVKQDITPDLVLPGVPLPVQLSPADLLSDGDPAEAVYLPGEVHLVPFLGLGVGAAPVTAELSAQDVTISSTPPR